MYTFWDPAFNSLTICFDISYSDLNQYLILLSAFAYFMDIPA